MKIGFIGAGKVGTSFGLFLKDRGQSLSGYASRTYNSACSAAELTSSKAFPSALDLIRYSDLVFLTTTDDQIESLAGELADALQGGKRQSGPIFVHMSGAHSTEALASLRAAGYEVAALHPLQSVSQVEQARHSFGSALFSVETATGSRFDQWVKSVGIDFVLVAPEDKPLYHAGAVFASNFLTTVMDTAIRLFESVGFTEEEAVRGLMPLIRGSVTNVERFGPEKALTGPIARGDCDTVARHLEALKSHPETKQLYISLAQETLSLAKRHKLKDSEAAAAIETLLTEEAQKSER
jgi:predicted short-subunit dehydrogenase-like oxidoreductase (DUF2520 family)